MPNHLSQLRGIADVQRWWKRKRMEAGRRHPNSPGRLWRQRTILVAVQVIAVRGQAPVAAEQRVEAARRPPQQLPRFSPARLQAAAEPPQHGARGLFCA